MSKRLQVRGRQASLEFKLAVIRKAGGNAAPTGDIDQMLAEIEQAYRRGAPGVTVRR